MPCFGRQDLLEQHESYCRKNGPQKIRMPSEDNDILHFKDVQKQLKIPVVIYADFETILTPCTQDNLIDDVSYTQKTHEHQVCGFCYIAVSDVEDFNSPPVVYRGENAAENFLECLLIEEKRIRSILEHVVPMELSTLDEYNFQRATSCHICDGELGVGRVHDHCHLTGRFRGSAHNDCNLNYKFTKCIPVAFHNLKNLYITTNVLLLADVFENFRDICLLYYKLDPMHFYTAPGLSWAACLKMTNVELELLTDVSMHLFIEAGLCGGISVICNRYSQANNKYLPNFRPDEESTFIIYLDANNLYGYAMSQPLLMDSFAWLSEEEFDGLDILNVSENSDIGYILEVDLEYPTELHDLHSDFPLCPEKVKITDDMLSPYCQQLKEDLGLKESSIDKLIPNLHNKTRYILHYKNLKLYLDLGMKLMKVHRVLTFHQSPWLKEYIDFNTEKRKLAANDFEKDFFKLLNNAAFGKTMENLRNRVNVELVTTEKRLLKLTKSPSFNHFRIFTPNIAAVNSKKTTLYLN